jgi:hypothetical protein
MLNTNHPDDELLSALASHDADATADASLTDHVASCTRCTALVDEFGAIRALLAELPDLQPNRPLRLLPDVPDPGADRIGGWARRVFGPVLAAGAALALVGMIGTAAPNLTATSQSAAAPSAEADDAIESAAAGYAFESAEADRAAESLGTAAESGEEVAPAASPAQPAPTNDRLSASGERRGINSLSGEDSFGEDGDTPAAAESPAAERSPWPMVLFTGVALMVAAGLLRWILAPRAG